MNLIKCFFVSTGILICTNVLSQSTTASNVLTGTAPNSNEYIGSSNAYDVIFKSGATEKMRLVNSTSHFGIGTSAPGAKLDVLKTNATQLRLSTSSTVYTDFKVSSLGQFAIMPVPLSGQQARIGFNVATPLAGFHSNLGIVRITDPSSSTSGIVIGPTYTGFGDMPAGPYISPINTTANEGISLTGGNAADVKIGAYVHIVGPDTYKSVWETKNEATADPNLWLVKSGGKVGIGTGATAPDKILTVKSPVLNTQIAKFADDARYIGLGRDEVAAYDLSGNLANMYLGGAKLNILSDGKVGIGTTAPYKLFTVMGDASFINTGLSGLEILGNGQVPSRRGISLDNDPSGKFSFYIHPWQTNAGFYFNESLNNTNLVSIGPDGKTTINAATKTNKYFVINDISTPGSPQETFIVQGNGKTEINYNSATATDDVFTINYKQNNTINFKVKANGLVYAREVNVLSTTFPDYVFEKNYNLLTIKEVNRFIQENKHLPGFNKAEYYEKNGIKTSEMFVKQQEKIEELFLYIIEQQKQIDELKNRIADLKK